MAGTFWTHKTRYTYTGREWDNDTQLYHFRARTYEPKLGRFLGRDPLGYVDGMSLYRGYMGIISTDPTGTNLIIMVPGDGDERKETYDTFVEMLKELCQAVKVDDLKDGIDEFNVTINDDGNKDLTPEGCCCLKELIDSEFNNYVRRIKVRETISWVAGDEGGFLVQSQDGTWVPGTPKGGGTRINFEQDSNEVIDDKVVDVPLYIVLGHELCGHIRFYNLGTHRPHLKRDKGDIPNPEIDAVEIENKLREKHGIPLRIKY